MMTNEIRAAIKMKNNAYKEYVRSGMRYDYYARFENQHRTAISTDAAIPFSVSPATN